jgi:hypothetical protein
MLYRVKHNFTSRPHRKSTALCIGQHTYKELAYDCFYGTKRKVQRTSAYCGGGWNLHRVSMTGVNLYTNISMAYPGGGPPKPGGGGNGIPGGKPGGLKPGGGPGMPGGAKGIGGRAREGIPAKRIYCGQKKFTLE